mmetsp:Transcript_16200/g.49503  ORF Transcript_16200/g.49503 Transcript_16200/m.49503 type:complete len:319 (-) Transcript_16200:76-1032(-)
MSAMADSLQRLTAACAAGDVEAITSALAENVNINEKGAGSEERPLHSAATSSLAAVQLLVGQGADVSAKDSAGNTALHFAAKSSQAAEIIPYLIEQGMDIEAKNKAKQTPLLKAVAEGNADAVTALIQSGANTEEAMMEAVKTGAFHVGTVAALLEHAGGPEVLNSVDAKSKEPALHVLAGAWGTDAPEGTSTELPEGWVQHADACSFFLDNGADLEIQNKNKENVIHCLATKDGSKLAEAMNFFAERGANLNSKNKKNQTPLLAAASKCRSEAIAALVGCGVNLNARDAKRKSVVAALPGHPSAGAKLFDVTLAYIL